MRILLVEDEALTAFVVADALAEAGHVVVGPAASVAAALWLVQQEPVDLALLDIDLGTGGDGTELAKCLHKDHRIPSLFVSGSPERARAANGVALGLLHKPCSPEQVVSAVTAVPVLLAGETPDVVPRALELFPSQERLRA